ncbi:helix-turn-helix transcriptional regulator [Aurantimicrobium minutum]|uniref:helix-turn-helix transcriptional regulator n=1 Tax=Aurantimicrobium minutum TaxID=708131 RepID=UPI002473ACAF|nr:helix-turn-helix transcriptional regulator [Aurantimicrobium minutum]MDH6537477.1 putative transcriptional regulator [Aurantimicrobium minutum]
MSEGIKNNEHGLAVAIRSFRKSRGLTQEALALKAGLDRKTINRIEKGHYAPTMTNFFQISEALEVEPHELLSANVSG